MRPLFNPSQITLFPDMYEDLYLPPITSHPDFEQELENFVRLADFGALLDLNFHGLEKSYSMKLNEFALPPQNLREDATNSSPTFYLFPLAIRNRLNRFKYDVRAFFNDQNSLRSPSGYFLLRNFFHTWEAHRAALTQTLLTELQSLIGGRAYHSYLDGCISAGLEWLSAQVSAGSPYQRAYPGFAEYEARRKLYQRSGVTLSQIQPEEPDYLFNCTVIKTEHLPLHFSQYLKGIAVTSTFKTIHPDYLKDLQIETLRDVKHLLEALPKKKI